MVAWVVLVGWSGGGVGSMVFIYYRRNLFPLFSSRRTLIFAFSILFLRMRLGVRSIFFFLGIRHMVDSVHPRRMFILSSSALLSISPHAGGKNGLNTKRGCRYNFSEGFRVRRILSSSGVVKIKKCF